MFRARVFQCLTNKADTKKKLESFHDTHNHVIHWHLFSHTALLSWEILEGNPKGMLKQSWLLFAVIPVHLRRKIV